jgi:hypothetical protein
MEVAVLHTAAAVLHTAAAGHKEVAADTDLEAALDFAPKRS